MRCPDCNKFVSLELQVTIRSKVIATVQWSDKVAASSMDELV